MNAAAQLLLPPGTPPQQKLLSPRFEFVSPRSSSSRSATQRQMLAEFKYRLSSGQYQLVHQPCPCAGDPSDLLISEIDRYGLPLRFVLCLSCGTVRIDPYLDASSLESFYRELYQELYGRALEPPAYFERQRAYGRKVLATMTSRGPVRIQSVLEIGCGAGGGLSEFAAAGCPVAGCDYSEPLVDYGSQRGIPDLCPGGVDELRKQLPDRHFDLIFLHHVYEHVGEPLELLGDLRSILAPGGRILIIVPDLSRIDRFVNPAGNALEFFHIAHKYNYSLPGIRAIAGQAGLAAAPLVPPRRMKTAWSRSPELWVELTIGAPSEDSGGLSARPVNAPYGRELWHYLQRTERLYQWGLCRAQLLARIRSLSPDRILARLLRMRHEPLAPR